MKQCSPPPLRVGERVTVAVAGLGTGGEGVGRWQGFTVFVPHVLPGEEAEVRITTVKKRYARGELVRLLTESPQRVAPPCPVYQRCGGCQLQHLSYAGQLQVKQRLVEDALAHIGGLRQVAVHATRGAADPWHYRNKMQFPVGRRGRDIVIGCYAPGTHDIVDTAACAIQQPANNTVAAAAREAIASLGIAPYDERTGRGIIRHVLGRVGTASGDVMVVLVTATDALPHAAAVIAQLRRHIPGLASVVQNVNPRRTNVILGDKTRVLWGRACITDRLGPFTFNISAQSFFQVNTAQAQVLYDTAVAYAGLTGSETVIDVYCGTGTISLFLARRAARVYGVEEVAAAVDDARANARLNGVDNVEFIAGDATAVMPRLYEQGARPDVIVTDPPRAGCTPAVLDAFAAMRPRRIVYVSCNPASLARDLAYLAAKGYEAREIQPVDMFPQTCHVECVVLMSRQNP